MSVTGGMPDAYFLQLTKDDALIIILGPRDVVHDRMGKVAGPGEYLPAKEVSPTRSDKRAKQ